jgi:cell division protein FtsA
MGATTTEFVCYKGTSLIYNGFIPVGSNHITNDLSVMLHTPPIAAEKIKTEYGDLLKNIEEISNKKVRTPRIGDEKNSSEVPLAHVQTIIHARVEEILTLIRTNLKKSGIHENLGAGIVITGGMSKLIGLKELATLVFDNLPIKISNPVNIKNGYISFEDERMATIVGILLYSLEPNRNFELDSNKKLMKKIKIQESIQNFEESVPYEIKEKPVYKEEEYTNDNMIKQTSSTTILPTISKDKKGKGISKFWNVITEWF